MPNKNDNKKCKIDTLIEALYLLLYSKRFEVKLNQTKLLKRELKNKLNDQKYNYSLW